MEQSVLTLLNKSKIGYAIHEMIYDDNGNPIDYRFLGINQAGLDIMQTDERTIGKTVLEWSNYSSNMKAWIDRYGKVILENKIDKFEMYSEVLEKWFSVTASKIEDNKFACSYFDITSFVKMKDELENTSQQFEKILENTTDLILFLTPQLQIQYFNLKFCDFFEIDCSHLNKNITKNILEKMIHYDFLHHIQAVLDSDDQSKVIFHQHGEGQGFYEYVEWKATEIHDEKKEITGYLLVGHDVSAREKEKIALHKNLYLDSLTGLANKNYLVENFDDFINFEGSCLAGIFIDLDNFKMVNDLFGHDAGNEFLKLIAKKLQKVTNNDGIVVRLSGDEFFILINEIHERNEIIEFMDRLFLEFEEPFDYEECAAPIFVNFSAGISCYGEDANTITELLAHSDIAMYFAKQNGKNAYGFYNANQEKEVFESFFLLQDLINALRNQEFLAYYQPVIETSTMRVIEFEALGRWNHPLYGVLPARDFIDLTKISGRLGQFTEQVIKNVAEDMKNWHELGLSNINVSLNLAIEQLETKQFPSFIEKTFDGIDLSKVRIQITEEDLIQANEIVLLNLTKLRKMGLLISLNDFDLNHSAISKMEDVDFDVIKLDISFSHNISDSEYSKIVIDMMQRLVKAFGKECIVQGVETKEHFQIMNELDFHIMQGYYFSDAISSAQVANLIDPKTHSIIWKSDLK